jgi:hypothetical protein
MTKFGRVQTLGDPAVLTNIAAFGPLVPRERSLPVLVGGGYVVGDFLFTIVVGAGGTALASIHRRRVGVLVALLCLAGWIAGRAADADAYPWVGSERSLFDVGGWFGMGPIAVAALLWLLVGRGLVRSRDISEENEGSEETGRSFGVVLAGAYLYIWSGIEETPSDGNEVVATIAGVLA